MQAYIKQDPNGMAAADGVSILLEVRGERSWRKLLNYAHPLKVQVMNTA